jgi:ABC-type proline/glycine betaine transport system permease subunit
MDTIFDFTIANLEPLVIIRLTQEPLENVIKTTIEAGKTMSTRPRLSLSRVNMREAIEEMKK